MTEVPAPRAAAGQVVIRNRASIISAGTERAAMALARRSLAGKALARPDQVQLVLQKVRTEGVAATVRAVQARLDEPLALGYSSAGVVVEVGAGVRGISPGDRVASNGPHAEVVSVPRNLCARIPDGVADDQAAMTVLAAIALHAVRTAKVELGETVFVIGLGLVGQLAVGLLRAAGCRVIATDLDPRRCELAVTMGAGVARAGIDGDGVFDLTAGLGADACLVAAATRSSDPMRLAIDAVRQRGRVVLVGDVGMELDRRGLYFKEAEVVVSRSYGPGRYDTEYEERGHDYPPAYVRWTEGRNLEAVLALMGDGRLDVGPLITHRFPVAQAATAYELVDSGAEPHLGIVLEYPDHQPQADARRPRPVRAMATEKIGVGVLGAGQFARSVMLPAIQAHPALTPVAVASASGVSASTAHDRFKFGLATADEREVIEHPDVDAVWILTRHDQHARQVIDALRAGKHVFVEKPLCLALDELEAIERALEEASDRVLMVGFNRRFAPATLALKSHFATIAPPLTISIRFNAGALPPDHWTQNELLGGGRIVGEACHAIDLATHLTGSIPVRVFTESIGGPRAPEVTEDQCFITLKHADGSVSSIGYLAGGDTAYPKERVEVLGGGRVGMIDDFRALTLAAEGKVRHQRLKKDKGHRAELDAFVAALRSGDVQGLPSWDELKAVTLFSIKAVESLRRGLPLDR